MERIHQEADKFHKSCFLYCAETKNMQFYQKLGYIIQSKQIVYDPTPNEKEDINEDKNPITVYLMTRDPILKK